ncbi:MAG: DHH family phosphoesterase [Pseudomonadota bacterium]
MDEYSAFIERLKKANNFLIASHYSPDGDGIGSAIALGIALEKMGKKAVLYSLDAIPENLKFLPYTDRFIRSIPPDEKYDMAIMVDCAQRKRISDEFAAHRGFGAVACIDHHVLEKAEADLLLLDGQAASTGEVVMGLMKHAGVEVDADVAQLIYTTLVVDTGFFKYSSTNAHALSLAAELVEKGAQPWVVAKNLEESFPAARLKLLARSLSTLEIDIDGRYACMEVTKAMLDETSATVDFSDEFATYPRAIRGVEVAALFREVEKDLTKVSLRSKDIVDVAMLAKSMGGGGHARAAGVRVKAPLAEAKKRIREAVEKALQRVK